jgi:hypothetical protein
MCDACMEMELYFAYLSEVEAKKQLEQQAAQPWQCEVTVFPAAGEGAPAPVAAPAKDASRFVCDEPE